MVLLLIVVGGLVVIFALAVPLAIASLARDERAAKKAQAATPGDASTEP